QRRHHRVQPEQARRPPQHRLLRPTARRLQAQLGAHLLESGFQVPPARVGLNHLRRRPAHGGREEVLIPMRAGAVMHPDPQDRHQRPAGLIPVRRAGDHLNVAAAPPPPGDVHPPAPPPPPHPPPPPAPPPPPPPRPP